MVSFYGSETRTCPKCSAAQEHMAHSYPYWNLIAALWGTATLIVLLAGVGVTMLSLYGFLSALSSGTQQIYSLLGTCLTTVGVLLLVNFLAKYYLHNVYGYTLFAAITESGQMHVHRVRDDFGSGEPPISVDIRITGFWQPCSIRRHQGPELYRMWSMVDIAGPRILLRANDGDASWLYLRDLRTVLHLLLAGRHLNAMAEYASPGYDTLLVGCIALGEITSIDDPLHHGKSKHGQTLHAYLRQLFLKVGIPQNEKQEVTSRVETEVARLRAEKKTKETAETTEVAP